MEQFRNLPLGIQSYNVYNTLMVSAPEIRGLWDFTLFPGTLKEDGTTMAPAFSDAETSLIRLMVLLSDTMSLDEPPWDESQVTASSKVWKYISCTIQVSFSGM